MKKFLVVLAAVAFVAAAGSADAKGKKSKNAVEHDGVAELSADNVLLHVKAGKGGKHVKKAILLLSNTGSATAVNGARVEWWLSNDDVLTTEHSGTFVEVDRMIASQSIGKVKAGRQIKRTLGGGALKGQVLRPGQYLFAVVDPDGVVPELDKSNNVSSVALPGLPFPQY